MHDFVGMPNKITCVDRTGDVEWPSPIRVGVPRWDAVHSHLPQSYGEAKTWKGALGYTFQYGWLATTRDVPRRHRSPAVLLLGTWVFEGAGSAENGGLVSKLCFECETENVSTFW